MVLVSNIFRYEHYLLILKVLKSKGANDEESNSGLYPWTQQNFHLTNFICVCVSRSQLMLAKIKAEDGFRFSYCDTRYIYDNPLLAIVPKSDILSAIHKRKCFMVLSDI